ncbi:Uncharacterised protein [uncultured archaeon]|nr:Uncharacterised protein [uncultured archaeon]
MNSNIFPEKNLDKLSLNDFLNMSDVASAARQLEEAVDRELNLDEKKTELQKKLLDAASARGEPLTPAQADIAVENFFEGLYSFKEPKRTFETRLAEIYVDRVRIGKFYGIPAIAAAVLAGVVWTGSSIASSIHRQSLERGVEAKVEKIYNERQRISMDVDEINSSPVRGQLSRSEQEIIIKDIELTKRDLKDADKFFLEFCPGGSAEKGVTQENYTLAESKLASINGSLNDAETQIRQARGLIETQEKLGYTRKNLDSLMGEIKTAKPIPVFLSRAENAYNSGLAAISRRQINEANNSGQQLLEIKRDISEFSGLSERVEKAYSDIKSVAKENAAINQGEELYREAAQLVRSANVPRLSETAQKLETLDETLNQEYKILIVDRPGWKTGDDRYYNNDRSKPSYYVLVEAIDSSGRALPRNIRNSGETGQTERVTMWGEGVTPDTWERIKADKMDNHHVDNNEIGYKKRGYLNETKTFYGLNGKQITQGNWRK